MIYQDALTALEELCASRTNEDYSDDEKLAVLIDFYLHESSNVLVAYRNLYNFYMKDR